MPPSSKASFVMVFLVIVVSTVDSQFIKLFYPTVTGTPGDAQILLFLSLVIVGSIINIIFLQSLRANAYKPQAYTPLFKVCYYSTVVIQYSLMILLAALVYQTIILHGYNKIFPILEVYLTHIVSALILCYLSFVFIRWFRSSRSFSLLTYGCVFGVIALIILFTVPLLTEQFELQPDWIYPRAYAALITDSLIPSPDIAFIASLGNYALPVVVFASWVLTAALLKSYSIRVGKIKFWLIISAPLVYQVIMLIMTDPNLVTNPSLLDTTSSVQFLFLSGFRYQASGIIFAIGFWIIGRKIHQQNMKNSLAISAIGMIMLFGSLQPGSPFFAAYPPFGLVALLFLVLSSYMLLTGLVGSAIYVSKDSELRREVYRGLREDSHILKMGVAEMQREIEKRVVGVLNRIGSTELRDEAKVEIEPDDEDVQTLIQEVLKEVHSKVPPPKPEE